MKNELSQSVSEMVVMQAFAVGNDLVFLPDFEASFNDNFRKKVYTANEIAYCEQFEDKLLRYASTWAAKEAVYKAMKQIDPSVLGYRRIEIIREKTGGKPSFNILNVSFKFKSSLSISHDGDYAWAVAFIEPI